MKGRANDNKTHDWPQKFYEWNGHGWVGVASVDSGRHEARTTGFRGGASDTARLVIIPMDVGWGARKAPQDPEPEENPADAYFKADAQGKLVLPDYFSALEPFRTQMNVFDGFLGTWWGNAHDVSWSDYLTNFATPNNNSFVPSTSQSIDDIVARALGTKVYRGMQGGGWGQNVGHTYELNNGALRRAPDFRDPRAGFQSMVGMLPVSNAGAAPAKFDHSALLMDYVKGDLNKIKQRVPATAFENLESHLTALEALQKSTNQSVAVDGDKCEAPQQPTSFVDPNDEQQATFNDYQNAVRAHFAIIRAGLQCGTHRVATYVLGNGFGPILPLDWAWTDTKGAAHKGNIWSGNFHEDVTHWDGKGNIAPDVRKAFEGSIAVRVKFVAEFVQSLKNVVYPDGSTLLDKTFIVLTGEVSDGSHNTGMKPMITIGGGKFLRTNRYVKTPCVWGPKWWPDSKRIEQIPQALRDLGLGDSGAGLPLRTEGDWWMGVAKILGVNLTSFGNPKRHAGTVDLA